VPTRRYALIAVAIRVALVAIVLILGFQLARQSPPVPSPTPSATAAVTSSSASPTASPASSPCLGPCGGPTGATSSAALPVPIYNDDFGFVVSGGDGPPHATIRKESGSPGTGTQFAPQTLSVSADGTRIAYWTLYPAQPELHVLNAGSGTEQTLVTLPADQRGGGVAWSTDGAGLLYSTESGGSVGGGPNSATLNIYELATSGRHGATIDTQTNTGLYYRPIAWDRSASLAAAGLVAEGGSMWSYVTVRFNPDKTFSTQRVDTGTPGHLGILMQSVRASTDAHFALGVDFESGDITWWPLSDATARTSQRGAGKRGALWRPGTHEIGFLGPSDQFWLGNVDTAGSLGLCCTAFSAAPAASTLRTFRADGTAVVLGVGAANPFLANYTLVRFGSDPKSTSGDRVTFQDLAGLAASVRLR